MPSSISAPSGLNINIAVPRLSHLESHRFPRRFRRRCHYQSSECSRIFRFDHQHCASISIPLASHRFLSRRPSPVVCLPKHFRSIFSGRLSKTSHNIMVIASMNVTCSSSRMGLEPLPLLNTMSHDISSQVDGERVVAPSIGFRLLPRPGAAPNRAIV
jgi:hypothetical protein